MPRFMIVVTVLVAGFASAASAAGVSTKSPDNRASHKAADTASISNAHGMASQDVAKAYNWGGFYVGLNGGGGSGHNCWTPAAFVSGPAPPGLPASCSTGTGGLAGGQVGYRWQATNWVFGLEAQGDWANLKGASVGLTGTFGIGVVRTPTLNATETDAIGLFTGQVGYAWNNLLGYLKGGAALTHNRYNGLAQFAILGLPAGYAFDGANEVRWGGVAGIGVEYGFAPDWSIAFEYDHLFMGRSQNDMITPAGAFGRASRIQQDIDIGTVRLNYRFGGPAVARY